jgi:hypothetical protein
MISQGVAVKILLDSADLKTHLTEAYGISEDALLVINEGSDKAVGIEDVFAPSDYRRILADAGHDVADDELAYGNGEYAKTTNKRLVAQTFLNHAERYSLANFDEATQVRIAAILDFCLAPNWWALA